MIPLQRFQKCKKKIGAEKVNSAQGRFFLRHTLLRATSGDPKSIMRTSNSDSGAVTGLHTWHQVTREFAGSSKPGRYHCSSRSRHLQSGTLRSQRMSFSSIIIGWSSSQSMSDSTTWTQVHALLINYFNTAAPVETEGIYQLNNLDKKEEVNFVRKGKAKGQKSKDLNKGKGQKDPQATSRIKGANQKAKERPSQKAKVNGPLGHGVAVRTGIRIEVKVIKQVTKLKVEKGRSIVRSAESLIIKLISPGGSPQQHGAQSQTASELKASSQHVRVSSGSTNSDSSSRQTSRISRSTTSCSTSTKRTKTSSQSLWVNVFCSPSIKPKSSNLVVSFKCSQGSFVSIRCGISNSKENAPVGESKGLTLRKHLMRFSIPNELFGVSSVSYLVSEIHRDHGCHWQIHLTQVLQKMNLSQMRSSGDDLAVSGESSSVQSFFQEIQKVFSLKHTDYLKNSLIIWRVSSTSSRVTANGVKIQLFQKRIRSEESFRRIIHSTQRRHPVPNQGGVKIFVTSPKIRLQQPPASSQVCQSDQRFHLRHGP